MYSSRLSIVFALTGLLVLTCGQAVAQDEGKADEPLLLTCSTPDAEHELYGDVNLGSSVYLRINRVSHRIRIYYAGIDPVDRLASGTMRVTPARYEYTEMRSQEQAEILFEINRSTLRYELGWIFNDGGWMSVEGKCRREASKI